MRTAFALIGAAAFLVIAVVVDRWFDGEFRLASATFSVAGIFWYWSAFHLATAGVALALGVSVLRSARPDMVVGAVFALVGTLYVLLPPLAFAVGLGLPTPWLEAFSSRLELASWAAAAIAVIGLAELVRWLRSDRRPGAQ